MRTITSASRKQAVANHSAVSELAIDSSTPVEVVLDNVKKLGRHFHLFYGLFIAADAATIPRPTFSSTDSARYANAENTRRGISAELYECIPLAYYPLIFTPDSTVGTAKHYWTDVSILFISYLVKHLSILDVL